MCRLIFFVLLASAAVAGDLPAQSSRDTVRYDGIYQSQEVEWMEWGRDSVRVWNYLRFTPDGMVVGFPTIGTPEQLGNFFARQQDAPEWEGHPSGGTDFLFRQRA
jgi:hypothetical protein